MKLNLTMKALALLASRYEAHTYAALRIVTGAMFAFAVVYCFLFLFIAAHGGGPYSADAGRRR